MARCDFGRWRTAATFVIGATARRCSRERMPSMGRSHRAARDGLPTGCAGKAGDDLALAKAAVDKANAAVAPLQGSVAAKDVVAKAYAEAAAKVKDAAGKMKDNKDLAAAANKSQELATQAAAELTAAQKALA